MNIIVQNIKVLSKLCVIHSEKFLVTLHVFIQKTVILGGDNLLVNIFYFCPHKIFKILKSLNNP